MIKLLPIQYKSLLPEDKFLLKSNNPPSMIIEFFNEQKNINSINCFSNEGGDWKKSKLKYFENKIEVLFEEKFIPRRGKLIVLCKMRTANGWELSLLLIRSNSSF